MVEKVPIEGSKRRERVAPLGAHHIGPADDNERITVSVMLRHQTASKVSTIAKEIGTHGLKEREHLTRHEFVTKHGASHQDAEKVVKFAQENDMRVIETNLARRLVRLQGSVGSISDAFDVKSVKHFAFSKGVYRIREGELFIPKDISAIVRSVHGIDNFPVVKPRFHQRSRPLTSATKIASAYNFPTGVDGAGQCVGLLEFGGGYTNDDLNTYFGNLGLATPSVTPVSVDGGTNSPGDPADGEVELDIEVVGAVAPGAKMAVYFAPNTDAGFIDAVTYAIHDTANNPSIISISWGGPENGPNAAWASQTIQSLDQVFQDAVSLGVTVLAASGDGGSSDGTNPPYECVDFPASDPFVMACGGTTLNLSDSSISSECCWSGSGGGVSCVFGLPTYQAGVGVPAAAATSSCSGFQGRGVPDVSGNADPNTGYDVVVDGAWTVVGGTSAVAPLCAGLIALINQSIGTKVGFVNPLLYSCASTFNNITCGGNDTVGHGNYSAGPGWHACTGLGSPNGISLLTCLQTAGKKG
jgi:kumamolisin